MYLTSEQQDLLELYCKVSLTYFYDFRWMSVRVDINGNEISRKPLELKNILNFRIGVPEFKFSGNFVGYDKLELCYYNQSHYNLLRVSKAFLNSFDNIDISKSYWWFGKILFALNHLKTLPIPSKKWFSETEVRHIATRTFYKHINSKNATFDNILDKVIESYNV